MKFHIPNFKQAQWGELEKAIRLNLADKGYSNLVAIRSIRHTLGGINKTIEVGDRLANNETVIMILEDVSEYLVITPSRGLFGDLPMRYGKNETDHPIYFEP